MTWEGSHPATRTLVRDCVGKGGKAVRSREANTELSVHTKGVGQGAWSRQTTVSANAYESSPNAGNRRFTPEEDWRQEMYIYVHIRNFPF